MLVCAQSKYPPALSAGKVSHPGLMSHIQGLARSRVRVDQCVSAVRAVEVPVLVCLRSSCIHVTEVGGRKVCVTRD
jgi:hypothetical protein